VAIKINKSSYIEREHRKEDEMFVNAGGADLLHDKGTGESVVLQRSLWLHLFGNAMYDGEVGRK
jgi:hypothetical protein